MADFNLEHVKQFRFKALFNELGWDQPAQQQPYTVTLGDEAFALDLVAHKKGVQVLHCRPDAQGRVPDYAKRQRIERKVTAEAREHLMVFTDSAQTVQVWQWVSRMPGKPAQYRELFFRPGESAELLKQKLSRLRFTLDEEELLTVLGVTQRLDDAVPRDRVTKKFYTEFKKQRDAFEQFIAGIPKLDDDLHWYAAVLIDRLMFIWFLQEKQFLDGKKRYLQERLAAHGAGSQTRSFYTTFLCPLFFRGFALERTDANRALLEAEFGKVPYLNGGLFSQHELEERYGDALDVADAALDKLFGFFDAWEWHLDDRPLKNDREINPDVLGYIFEKFVNQKQMGAYYTKEDITEYIGKNTIIPALLHKLRRKYPSAFDALAWPLLQAEPDRYLYPAMLKGMGATYPAEIEAGRDTDAPELLARRKSWNAKTPDSWALPTEIWRETVARHDRTREVRAKLVAGEVREIGDLITYNLDIRRFAQDVIERCDDAALLRECWAVLAGRVPRKAGERFRPALSVLDPTCGSGAFLFAALNILKPLYDAALGTMAGLLLDADQAGDHKSAEKWKDIEEVVERFGALSSDRARDYAVIKHIVVHNLYGVDIEEQATEIAKLRLFLKLVSLLEPGDTIEPLPDIDFNIRHGNTLVGYATADETEAAVKGATQGNLFSDAWEDIRIRLIAVEEAYHNFQIQQVQRGGHITAQDKQALAAQLGELEAMLNFHLCRAYGKDPTKAKQFDAWKASHKPFHWYVDFYPLMAAGGFDAVIGNPPYLQLTEVEGYSVKSYACADCGNLYAVMLERCTALVGAAGRSGFIVPVSSISTDGYRSLQQLYASRHVHLSCFDDRPSRLFEGLEHIRLVIALSSCSQQPGWVSTRYLKWSSDERSTLFDRLAYFEAPASPIQNAIAKAGSHLEAGIFGKLRNSGTHIALHIQSGGQARVHYSRKVGFFFQVLDFVPRVLSGDGSLRSPSEFKTVSLASEVVARAALAALNSSLFYWFVTVLSDCRHLNKREVEGFPLVDDLLLPERAGRVNDSVARLMADLIARSETRVMKFKHDTLTVQCLLPRRSWTAIQAIDVIVAEGVGLSKVEADYITNYDIKYRVGRVNGTDD